MSQLSPPWYTLWGKINASIGNCSGVTVGELQTSSDPFKVTITVTNYEQAVAMASIINLQYELSTEIVIEVKDGSGKTVAPFSPTSPDELIEFIKTALHGNGWFVDVAQGVLPSGLTIVFPIFSKNVIQFPNDNVADYYGNYNNVVAFVFQDILVSESGSIPIYCSTAED
jgi:hypothetical protein